MNYTELIKDLKHFNTRITRLTYDSTSNIFIMKLDKTIHLYILENEDGY